MKIKNIISSNRQQAAENIVSAPVRFRFWGFYFIILGSILPLTGLWIVREGAPSFLVVLVFSGIALVVSGIRLRLRDTISVVENDPRPPLLYLRGFRDDGTGSAVSGLKTRESSLMRHLRDFGPVLALGAPGERLPQLGAYRVYASHENWQEIVSRLMALSRLIILRGGDSTGDSPGLEWELLHIRRSVDPQKIIIWITSSQNKELYLRFRYTVQRCWNVSLPKGLNGRAFIVFNAQWEAQPVRSLLGIEDTFRQPYRARELSTWQLMRTGMHSEVIYLIKAIQRLTVTDYDRDSLLNLLRPMPLEVPPPFRLKAAAFLLLVVTWVCAFMRPSIVIEILMRFHEFFGQNSSLMAAGFECLAVGALAISLSFYVYLRFPKRESFATIIFCAVLLVDLVTFPWRSPLQGRMPLRTHAQIEAEREVSWERVLRNLPPSVVRPIYLGTDFPDLTSDPFLDTRVDELIGKARPK